MQRLLLAIGLAGILAGAAGWAAEPPSNSALLDELLRAGYPGATVRRAPAHCGRTQPEMILERPKSPARPCFAVTGALNRLEEEMAQPVTGDPPSPTRFVEVNRLAPVHGSAGADGSAYLLLTTTLFPYNVCNSCEAMARVTLLRHEGGGWHATAVDLSGSNSTIEKMSWLDLTGSGRPQLVVETLESVNAQLWTHLWVFAVPGGRLVPLADCATGYDGMYSGFTRDRVVKVLDPELTRATHGKAFVFHTTTYFRNNRPLRPPETVVESVPFSPDQLRRD